MNAAEHVVLVGGGLAGARAATVFREEGHDGSITLVGAEASRPYERPPLSKGYLLGTAERESLFVHPEGWYADNDVELRLSTRAAGLDAAAQQVVLDDGDRLRYDRLFLATGSVPRRLTVPGGDALQPLYLRTLDDSDRLRAAFLAGARVVIVGGGWIGLETAAAARAAGAEVVVLERAELPLSGVLGAEMATLFADAHRDHGVQLRCGARISGVRAAGPGSPGAGAVCLA